MWHRHFENKRDKTLTDIMSKNVLLKVNFFKLQNSRICEQIFPEFVSNFFPNL